MKKDKIILIKTPNEKRFLIRQNKKNELIVQMYNNNIVLKSLQANKV